jgi:NSS family neurotransmitter:Na+ symporter
MGTMTVYGSYITKKDNLVSSAGWVCFSTTLVALLAGIIIFPTLFHSLQLTPEQFKQDFEVGTGIMFQTFPIIISKMPGGYIFGIMFFSLLLIAALTSTISMLEVPTAYLVDEKNWKRKNAALFIGIIAFVLGIPSALSNGGVKFLTKLNVMTVMDLIFGNIMLALGGVLICLFLAYSWKVRNSLKEISIGNKRFKLKSLWTFNIKYLAPVVVTLILVFIVIQSIIG